MGPYGFRYDPTLGSMRLYGAIWVPLWSYYGASMGLYGSYGLTWSPWGPYGSIWVPPWSHYWVSTGLYGSIWVPLRSLWLLLWNLWDSLLATGPTLCPYGSLWGSTRLTEGRHHPPLLGAAMTPRASLPAQSGSRPQTGEKRRGWVGGEGGIILGPKAAIWGRRGETRNRTEGSRRGEGREGTA